MTAPTKPKVPQRSRGFQAMQPEEHRRVSSIGGKTSQAEGRMHRPASDKPRFPRSRA